MTSTLYFYKLPINLQDKNFVLESIETYLATLTPVTKTNFQYQRFDLEKTIKVNLSQDYQLNISAIAKYNYLKVTTQDSSSPAKTATYYYFIKKARQVSESTIEFTVEMDTLNTFNFSSTASNKSYTLSNKSLIQREHKDRLEKLSTLYTSVRTTAVETGVLNELSSYGTYQNTQDRDIILLFNSQKSIYSYLYNNSYISFQLNLSGAKILLQNGTEYSGFTSMVFQHIGSRYRVNLMDGLTSVAVINFFQNPTNEDYIMLIIPKDVQITVSISDGMDLTEILYCLLNDYTTLQIENNLYKRLVDYYQEGLGTILFKKSEETLYDEDGGKHWYVMFASANAIPATDTASSVKYVNPVQVRLYSDDGYSISSSSSHEVVLYATSSIIPKWTNTREELQYGFNMPASTLGEQYVKINGNTYDFHDYCNLLIYRKNNNDLYFSDVWITNRGTQTTTHFENVESVIFYGINEVKCVNMWGTYTTTIYIGSGANTSTGTCSPFNEIDLTDDRLIKCFVFPYAPAEFLVGKSSFDSLPNGVILNTDNIIELQKQQTPLFNYTKTFTGKSLQKELVVDGDSLIIASGQARNIIYESKLFHSDYYQPKFVYDSFAFSFNLENVNVDEYLKNGYYKDLITNYVVSQNVQSKFMFDFPQYVLDRSTQDYDNVLCIERNNEKALFNNAYINYIRSGGYSYDTKKASSQNAVNGITTALSIIGAVTSFASSGATGGAGIVAGVGLTLSATAGIIRTIHTAQEQDRAISQKINQNMIQGTSVQGSEDIDILTAISGNKAKVVYYELSDIMKNAIWDLFHYCGYATHEQKIPAVDTRLYFNFVQGEIILKDFTFNDDIASRIILKWREGVTFMHLVNSTYDFNQEYENFETSLM